MNLQPEMENVLELSQPEIYRCRVAGYLLERSLMVFEVSHDVNRFFVVLPDVQHYDGTFLWQGASLRIASRDEQFDYMLDRSIVAALGMLFVFESPDGKINVLAGDWLVILDELPDRFK